MKIAPLISWEGKTRMSLAGAQNKVALYEKADVLYLPMEGAPTNVILKAGINGHSINEYITSHLASYLGLIVPDTQKKRI